MGKNQMKVKIKAMSKDEEAVRIFLKDIDESYLALISVPKPSSDGGWHGFATVEVGEK